MSDITRLRQRLMEAKRELQDRNHELESVRERIEQLLAVGEIISMPEGLGPQLTKLVAELEKHARSGREREQLRQRWEQLHEKQNRLSRSAQQIVGNRRELMDVHGIPSMADFHESREQSQKCAKMRRERDQRIGKIVELTDGRYTADQLQAMLDNRPTKLVDTIHEFQSEHETLGNDIASLQSRAETLKQKLEDRMQDRRCEHKELALECVEQKIREAMGEWQQSALVSLVLDKVKKTYETKRQPVALAEASTHLERLTEGRYTRVWTPMGQDALCVDDRDGKALPVEKLSRGTRELVFLALRLALVSSYARRGASMPIVLDDVFVNFDDQRAQAVARVLADLANSGQQILIFTCHDRIRNIFHELGHDVRDLPLREGMKAPKPLRSLESPTQESPSEPSIIARHVTEATEQDAAASVPVTSDVTESKSRPVVEPDSHEELESLDDLKLVESQSVRTTVSDTFDRFTPAWRDEWLEPLPDIAPSGEVEDEP